MSYKIREGSGKASSVEKRNSKAPDMKGNLVLDRDYSKGSEIKLSFWYYPNQGKPSMTYNINHWNANPDKQWPKPVNEDETIPF
jgi:hypothetical protein